MQAKVPSNDGGISLGQAAVAAARLARLEDETMCLGIPGRIVAISDAQRKLAMVDVSGVKREINIACIIDDRRDRCLCRRLGLGPCRLRDEPSSTKNRLRRR